MAGAFRQPGGSSGLWVRTELAGVTTSLRPRRRRSCSFVMAFAASCGERGTSTVGAGPPTSLLLNSTNAYPRGLPFCTPVLWNMKSIFVTLPNLEKIWRRVYSSTVGDRLPTYRWCDIGVELSGVLTDAPRREGPAEAFGLSMLRSDEEMNGDGVE